MTQFRIDIDRLVTLLLLPDLRVRFNFIFVRAMVQPVASLLDKFKLNRSNNLYDLEHNGQVCYLRSMLNDWFDPSERRITIEDTVRYNWTFIYPEAADQPLWLETVPVASEAYTSDEGVDFTVNVPAELGTGIKPRMISLINYYKLAGKRYAINFVQ